MKRSARRSNPVPLHPSVRQHDGLRVVTYNIHSCIGTDRQHRPERIAEVLLALDADVVALQELDVGRLRTGQVDQVRLLADALGMHSVFQRAIRWPDGEYGIAVLSRLPVNAAEGRVLPIPALPYMQRRVAQLLRLSTPDGAIAFVNTHLGLLRGERAGQIDALLSWLQDLVTEIPTILCGDLNAPPHARECRRLDPVLVDAFGNELHGRTFPVHFPLSRIDQIRVSAHVECMSVAIPRNRLTRIASDHFPVVADLRIKESFRKDGTASLQRALEDSTVRGPHG